MGAQKKNTIWSGWAVKSTWERKNKGTQLGPGERLTIGATPASQHGDTRASVQRPTVKNQHTWSENSGLRMTPSIPSSEEYNVHFLSSSYMIDLSAPTLKASGLQPWRKEFHLHIHSTLWRKVLGEMVSAASNWIHEARHQPKKRINTFAIAYSTTSFGTSINILVVLLHINNI